MKMWEVGTSLGNEKSFQVKEKQTSHHMETQNVKNTNNSIRLTKKAKPHTLV